jgi:hypothetical protein
MSSTVLNPTSRPPLRELAAAIEKALRAEKDKQDNNRTSFSCR